MAITAWMVHLFISDDAALPAADIRDWEDRSGARELPNEPHARALTVRARAPKSTQ